MSDVVVETRRLARADVTASPPLVDALAALIDHHGTLYDWAASQPQPRALRGRAPVFVATIPGARETVVVRHAWHGGLLAPLTGDRFRRPSRAPLELARSAQLRARGIPTTTVLGFARHDAGPGLCRVDVVSRFMPDAYDLGAIAAGLVPDMTSDAALAATRTLLTRMADAGVEHPDLNVKNILLTRAGHRTLTAMVIDVDVIRWDSQRAPEAIMRANVTRLTRSIRKWRTHFGCDISESALAAFAREALASAASGVLT